MMPRAVRSGVPTVGALGDAGAVAEAMREQCSGMLRNFEKMVLWGIK